MKKISNLLMMALLAIGMGLTSCEGTLDDIFGEWSRPTGNNGNTKTTVAVKSVTLDQTTLTKAVGDDAVTLTATVDPSDASDKTVTWKSSDASIAAVDANGKVTFVAAGTATITATATNGTDDTADDKTAECAVTVNAAAVPVTSVTLDKAVLRIYKYASGLLLTATVSPADATDKTVTWTSSDTNVATVNASGKVMPQKAGTTTITATANDGSGMKATSTVYVYDKIVDINTETANVTVYDDEFWLINGNGTEVAYGINIGDGATVTLNGISITKQIACSSDATIILADGSTNAVTVSASNQAGIKVGGSGKTLTINAETLGTGKLNVNGGNYAAGIGGEQNCGRIIISGGNITATGRVSAGIGSGKDASCDGITISGGTVVATCSTDGGAGIGTGRNGSCGDINISGGTITATGANGAAGIGTGVAMMYDDASCGDITITADVTSVTATKGGSAPNNIGAGGGTNNTCGTVTIGGVVGAISTSPYTYQP